MDAIRAIIVDDELSSVKILSTLLTDFCPNVIVKATANNLVNAVELINNIKPDLVFLDIEMPLHHGYEIVHFFDQINFEIIFVTAYNQYAIKAFEISAIDYLVKPIEIERLITAVAKVEKKKQTEIYHQQLLVMRQQLVEEKSDKITIIDKGFKSIIDVSNIVAIEAQRAYCNIYMQDNSSYCVSKNLKHFESILSRSDFFRTHKSWLININYLVAYSSSKAIVKLQNQIEAKLSKYKIAAFEEFIN